LSERGQRRLEAALGQERRVDPTGQVPQLIEPGGELFSCPVEERSGAVPLRNANGELSVAA
jgi:hypothetical protein